MRFTNGSSVSWSWMQNADEPSDSERNTTAVTPEQPCVPQLPLRQHLTRLNSTNRCAPVERRKAREGSRRKRRGRKRPGTATNARSAGVFRGEKGRS